MFLNGGKDMSVEAALVDWGSSSMNGSTAPIEAERVTMQARTTARELALDGADLGAVRETREVDVQGGFVKDQIYNLARELQSLRQDINSLRMTDSQHEMQAAEINRHVREMQAAFRMEIQVELQARQEATARLESDIATALDEARSMKQKSEYNARALKQQVNESTDVQRLEDRLIRDLGVFDDRLKKVSSDLEERFARLKVEERVDQVVNGMVDALEARLADKQEAGLKKFSEELDILKSSPSTDNVVSIDNSSEVKLKQDMRELAENLENQVKNLQERLGLDLLAVDERLSKVMNEMEDRMGRDITATQDRVNQFDLEHHSKHADVKDGIISLVDEQGAKNAELKQFVKDLLEQERAAYDEQNSNMMEMLKQSHDGVREDMTKHREGLMKQVLAQLEVERSQRDEAHGSLEDRFEKYEQKMADHSRQLSKTQKGHTSALEEAEERLRREMGEHIGNVGSLHEETKGLMQKIDDKHHGKHADSMSTFEKKLDRAIVDSEVKLRQELNKLKQGLDAVKDNTRDLISQERQTREQHHGMLTEGHENLDRRIMEALMKLQADGEVKNSSLSSAIANAERKLREDMNAISAEHHAKHAENREKMGQATGELFDSFTELKGELAKHSGNQRDLLNDHRDSIAACLQELEGKLRREIASTNEDSKGGLLEQILRERQERENSHGGLAKSHEGLDKQLKDLQLQIASQQAVATSTATGNLNALERKLRDDISGQFNDLHGRHADLKDQLQRGLNGHGLIHEDLKDLVAKATNKIEQQAEFHRDTFTSNLEGLDSKLRREIGALSDKHQAGLREHLAQERQVRERTHASFLERLSGLERKIMTELSTASMARDAMRTEFQDVVSNAIAKERSNTQDVLVRTQELVASQIDNFQKVLLQNNLASDKQIASLSTRTEMNEFPRLDTITRIEFEGACQRLWEAIDTHTHTVANPGANTRSVEPFLPFASVPSQGLPRSSSPTAKAAARAVSPMPVQYVMPKQAPQQMTTVIQQAPQQMPKQVAQERSVVASPTIPQGQAASVSVPVMRSAASPMRIREASPMRIREASGFSSPMVSSPMARSAASPSGARAVDAAGASPTSRPVVQQAFAFPMANQEAAGCRTITPQEMRAAQQASGYQLNVSRDVTPGGRSDITTAVSIDPASPESLMRSH